MDKMRCNCCGKDKRLADYYASTSHFNKHTGKSNICKQCVWDYVEPENNNSYSMIKVKDVLRVMDKPFLFDLWESSIAEATNSKQASSYFRTYMKNVALPNYTLFTWEDSNHELENKKCSEKYFDTIDDFEVTTDIIDFWGKGFEEDDYSFLENDKKKLEASFECPDYGMEMIMKDISFINLEINKLRQDKKGNNQKTITNLIETRSKLMNDANMKPIQSTGAESNDQVTFGTLIRKWENERPVPKPIDDEMKEYIDTFMIGHLAKMQGLNNEATKKYDEALSEYTVKFEDINKDEEYMDD